MSRDTSPSSRVTNVATAATIRVAPRSRRPGALPLRRPRSSGTSPPAVPATSTEADTIRGDTSDRPGGQGPLGGVEQVDAAARRQARITSLAGQDGLHAQLGLDFVSGSALGLSHAIRSGTRAQRRPFVHTLAP